MDLKISNEPSEAFFFKQIKLENRKNVIDEKK